MVCERLGLKIAHENFFDTIRVELGIERADILEHAQRSGLQSARARPARDRHFLRRNDNAARHRAIDLGLSRHTRPRFRRERLGEPPIRIPQSAIRTSEFLTHPVFNTHHTETEMLRYLQEARIARPFADHFDDPARFVHDEVERDRGDVSGFVAGVCQTASVCA